MKYNFNVPELTYEEYVMLCNDTSDEVGESTVGVGRKSGLEVDWDDELGMLVSGDDEYQCVCFSCMCLCGAGHEEYYEMMERLMAISN